MQNINEIEELIKLISKLPGLGPKSAKRIVLKFINNREELIKPMAKALADVYKNISRCKICGILKPISTECNYDDCKIVEKRFSTICVVENISVSGALKAQIFIKVIFIFWRNTFLCRTKKEDLLINSL